MQYRADNAEHGSTSLGVLSNPIIEQMANTTHYEVTISINPDGSFHYKEDTYLQFKGTGRVFHHTDENTLKRVE